MDQESSQNQTMQQGVQANVLKIHSAGARVRVEMETFETQDVLTG